MNPYYEQKILNSDPIELIQIVYERAIVCVREAREHLQNRRIAERSAAIMRAYMAIAQLITALDREVAPDLCKRLDGLYIYMQQRLLEANAKQIEPPLVEVLGLLTTLAEGWSQVAAELALNGDGKTKARAVRSGEAERAATSYAMSV